MIDRDLGRVRAAYPALPDVPPPQATVARLRALYADADAIPDVRNRRIRRVESSGVPPSPGRDDALSSVSRLLAMRAVG